MVLNTPKSPPKRSQRPALTPAVSPPKAAAPLVSPIVMRLFGMSLLLAGDGFYVSQWNSLAPTFLSPDLVNPSEGQPQPAGLPLGMAGVVLPLGLVLLISTQLRWLPTNNLTRAAMKLLLAGFALHYFTWRTGTLNLSHWTSTVVSVGLFLNEAVCFASMLLYLVQSTWTTSQRRSAAAQVYAADVESGRYQPHVDVLVPTYNEPDYIVRRTVIGCQAMEYSNKTVYILDDTRRPHIRALAAELGCQYITRPDNTHAKAGNLNNALPQLQGELVSIMDADFVPFKPFLTRTVGFFQEPIALLQTQQNFYNADYQARNLGLSGALPNDLEHFYGHLQPARDVGNSVICCGTSYVARRQALMSVGGYYTRCCVEDFQTSVLLLTQGHRLAYLNEMLSLGESTRTYRDFIDQRLRWLQGNLQTFFCAKDLQLWMRLNWVQKSYLLSQLFYCFQSVFRLVFLLTPLLSAYLGIAPLLATLPEFVYYFLPFMALHIAVYGWSTGYRVSFFWNEIYETIFCFPGLRRIGFVLRDPFGKASRVTRKGVQSEGKVYNWSLTLPLTVLLGLSVFIIGLYVGGYWSGRWPTPPSGSWITLVWLGYNSVLLLVSILTAIDQPVRRLNDRFPLRLRCQLRFNGETYWGITENLSDTGALIRLDRPFSSATAVPIRVELTAHNLQLAARQIHQQSDPRLVGLMFDDMPLASRRKLVELIYCNPVPEMLGKPGGLDTVLSLLLALVQLRPILRRYRH